MAKRDDEMAATIREYLAVCPFDGGVQIEFHACGVDFEAVLDRDGNLREVSCLPVEAVRLVDEALSPDAEQGETNG